MTFSETQDYLRALIPATFSAKGPYKLDRMRQLARSLGDPQEQVRVVHVAGTSGKTSTSYHISRLLAANGHSVGLTISPHVSSVTERIQINGEPITEELFAQLFTDFVVQLEQSQVVPTYFEAMIAFAYWSFNRLGVQYAVIETGLGGTLDATNVVNRSDKVCVITDIGYDHTEILGDTIELIAQNKAGIIQAKNHAYMYDQGVEINDVFARRANSVGAQLQQLGKLTADVTESTSTSIPLYQQRNFGLALSVYRAEFEQEAGKIENDVLREISMQYVPGRLESITLGPNTVLLDGAHNTQKMTACVDSITQLYPDQKMAVLIAMLPSSGEERLGGLPKLASIANSYIATQFAVSQDLHKASMPPAELATFLQGEAPIVVIPDLERAIDALLTGPEPIKLVTGSFYLIGLVRNSLYRRVG